MSRRGSALKLALLVLPLAAGVAALHAFGEPAGRAARAASVAFAYPEHAHGPWRIRDRRGSDYHAFAAKILDEFAAPLAAWAAPLNVVQPSRVDVYLLDTRDDLERFGFDPHRLELEGLADPAAGVLAIVAEGRTHNQEQDAKSLRHWMTRLLLAPTLERNRAGTWALVGLAALFETVTPGATGVDARRSDLVPLPPLESILNDPPADFRAVPSPRFVEAARLWTAFLLDQKPSDFLRWLRGESAAAPDPFADCFGDRSVLERQWKEWLQRPSK